MRKITGLPELPPRRADSHKGDYGRVLVLAGSRGMVGAAALAGTAALRAGAGLVTVGTPRSVYPILAAQVTCCTTRPLPETPVGHAERPGRSARSSSSPNRSTSSRSAPASAAIRARLGSSINSC